MNHQRVKLRPEPVKTQDVELISCIAQLREESGMTQRQLADAVGVTESTIANWETGRRGLEIFHRVICLCHTLNCSPEDLIRYVVPEEGGNESIEASSFKEILDLMGTRSAEKRPQSLNQPTSSHSTK